MKTLVHRANSRGNANFGWLKSKHSFSFGQYYNPERIHFGMLRVLNDDIVAGGAGFPTHPHDNMEIVSIPLKGALAHRDSTGTEKIIQSGEVQIMSAGSGLTHSEYNASKDEEVNFLQIWVFPKEKDITPRYDQKQFDSKNRQNSFQTVVAPDEPDAVWINQDAWFSLADFGKGQNSTYTMKNKDNGVYVFVLEGEVMIANETLNQRDAMGIWDANKIGLNIKQDTKFLLIEVPMN